MKTKLFAAALAAALFASLSAVAADTPAKEDATAPDGQTAKADPVKKKVKPHSHVEAKGGVAPAEVVEAKEPPAKPLHDHQKVHKQM